MVFGGDGIKKVVYKEYIYIYNIYFFWILSLFSECYFHILTYENNVKRESTVIQGAAMLYVYVWDSLLHYESQTGLPLRWRFCLCCHWERIEIKLLADVRYMDVAFLVRGARPESKLFGRPSDPLNLWWFACSPPQALWTWNLWNLWFLRSLFPQAMHPV